MKKISLEDPIHVAYKRVKQDVLSLKSAVIGLYSDIYGYFFKRFGIEIGKGITKEEFEQVKTVFPLLSEMTLSQVDSLLNTFAEVRNINAHLYLSRKVRLDAEVEDYLYSIYFPLYAVTKDHYLTVYGQAYIAMFLCQKYNIWNFSSSFFKKFLKEFEGYCGNEISDYQVQFQHEYQKYCGSGKPIANECPLSKEHLAFMNQLFKRHMTEFVLSLEGMIHPGNKASEHVMNFKTMVQDAFPDENNYEAIDRIIMVRNCWLHGATLYDDIEYKGQNVCFDYRFLFESLIIIKKWMIRLTIDFMEIADILTKFGNACFCFYALRLVEVSYKLLDNRLLTQDKLDHRVMNLECAYENLLDSPENFLELAEELIEPNEITFKVAPSKFLDKTLRSTSCDKLRIVKLHSENGFQIGKYHTQQKNLSLVLADLNKEFQNPINGIYVADYFNNPTKRIGNRVLIDEIELKPNSIDNSLCVNAAKTKSQLNINL